MKRAKARAAPPARSRITRSNRAFVPARLMEEAECARRNAYAPYSRFSVGAALLTTGGRIVHGCNVENASFGLTICAERNAVWKAIGEGERDFVAVAVTAGPGKAASPCGSCRQVLHEFAPEMWVCWLEGRRIVKRRLSALLSHPFDLLGGRRR